MKINNDFIKKAIDKQNEISNGEFTHKKYLIFREWYFNQHKNISRREVVRSLSEFDILFGLKVPIKNDLLDEDI